MPTVKLQDVGPALQKIFGELLSNPKKFSEEVVTEALTLAGGIVQVMAIELAPYKTGDLEGSSSVTVQDNRAEITFGMDYAAEVHELPDNARGPGTQAKPGNELGPAGPKYLERPIIAMQALLPGIVGGVLTERLK